MTVQTMMEEIGKLNSESRLELAQKIWDSLDAEEVPTEPTANQKADLTRRMAELDADPSIGITWKELMKRVRAKL